VTTLCESDAAAAVREVFLSPSTSQTTLDGPAVETPRSIDSRENMDADSPE